MMSIFVSHIKHDEHIRKYFSQIFADKGLKATFIEFKKISGQYAGHVISQNIRGGILSGHDTAVLFVLLGKGLEYPPNPKFTHNWVAFEAGCAASCNKRVWVFEERESFIDYPIPFVTDYVLYTLDNIEDLQFLGDLFEQEIPNPVYQKIKYTPIKCAYSDCNAKYKLWSKTSEFYCPVCRRHMKFNHLK